MELTVSSRFKNAWNAFLNKDQNLSVYNTYQTGSFYKPDRTRLSFGNERSIITSVLNRISIDVSSIAIRHCKLDDNDRFSEYIPDDLDNCLSLDTNTDQTSRSFFQDVVLSMLDEGCVAIIPTDTSKNPATDVYKIYTMRTGKIVTWYPDRVRVNVYNERTRY